MKLFWLIFLIFPCLSLANKNNKLELKPQLKNAYLKLLNQASDFHTAISLENKDQIQKEIKETQEIIAELYSKSASLEEFHFRIHSHKLLKAIEEQLSTMTQGPLLKKHQEKKVVKKLFNSFFELAKVYDLTKDMNAKMFYCVKDRSLWFQTDKKAQNPISPDYKNCATQIL